ncbi:hypothetical protein J5N97_007249 [Dioscorea zingiberensis]|uniref:Protein XRI1 n=1 Tax=Dioscorea zingiberensis TaxID=325984 RepID=A0A9D5HUB1_9LILI|nr:hypothetical protein J5N97_007249 [Dioscorea zingiberensis]
MEFKDNGNKYNGICGWAGEDYSMQENTGLDVSHYLLDDVNQNEDSLLGMLEEHTPAKDSADFSYDMMNIGNDIDKVSEESRESSSSQQKRRRMLQFPTDSNEPASVNGPMTSFYESKARDEPLVEDGLQDNMDWNSQGNSGLSGDRCSYGDEGFNLSMDGWLEDCLNESGMPQNPDVMNHFMASEGQTNVSEFCNTLEMGNDAVEKAPTTTCRIFRGRKSFINSPMKLTTSVAYPFALIKPCGVQGDITLKDINQRIHAPPPSKSKNKKDEDSSMSYPTSTFSGKPVIVKTKIRTEGGKGSITIMRTKG